MGPELWVGIAAVFVSGGAIGSAGTLLAQWILGKLDGASTPRRELESAERDLLRTEVEELSRQVRNLDARLDFTEQLLGGAIPLAPPPGRLGDAPRKDAAAAEEPSTGGSSRGAGRAGGPSKRA